MIEKFAETLGGFIDKEGVFEFEFTSCEVKDSSKGTGPMAVIELKSSSGSTTVYHSLSQKAKWSYGNLVRAAYGLVTDEQYRNFDFGWGPGLIDYELIGQKMVEEKRKILGVVECQKYKKEIKTPNDDGTFATGTEEKDSYKIVEYLPLDAQ